MKVLLCLLAGLTAVCGQIAQVVQELERLKGVDKAAQENAKKTLAEKTDNYMSAIQENELEAGNAADKSSTAKAEKEKADAKASANAQDKADASAALSKLNTEHEKTMGALAARKKELEAQRGELMAAISALERALGVLKRSGAGALVQTKKALFQLTNVLQFMVRSTGIESATKDRLVAMIQQPQASQKGYESHGSDIIGMIENFKAEADDNLKNCNKDIMKVQFDKDMAIQNFNARKGDLEKEIRLTSATEAEQRGLEGGAAAKETRENQKLAELTKTVADLKRDMANDDRSYKNEISNLAEKIATYDQGIAKLNQRSAMFLQMKSVDQADVRDELATELESAAKRLHASALAQLAVSARDDPFAKVKDLIAKMIDRLEKQAEAEGKLHAWCQKEKSANEAKHDDASTLINKLNARVEKYDSQKADAESERSETEAGMAARQEAEMTATKIRAGENAEFKKNQGKWQQTSDALGKGLDVFAKMEGEAAAQLRGVVEDIKSGLDSKIEASKTQESSRQDEFDGLKNDNKVSNATDRANSESLTQMSTESASQSEQTGGDLKDAEDMLAEIEKAMDSVRDRCTKKPMSFEERQAKRQQEIDSLNNALDILAENA